MCNFSQVRAWLLSLSFVVSAAASSTYLASIFSELPPPLSWVGSICYWAAASWCGIGLGFVFLTSDAIRTYCKCAAESGSAQCAEPCRILTNAVYVILVLFAVGGAVCVKGALVAAPHTYWNTASVIFATLLLASLIALWGFSTSVETCQDTLRPPAG
jgi:hypothetical protein